MTGTPAWLEELPYIDFFTRGAHVVRLTEDGPVRGVVTQLLGNELLEFSPDNTNGQNFPYAAEVIEKTELRFNLSTWPGYHHAIFWLSGHVWTPPDDVQNVYVFLCKVLPRRQVTEHEINLLAQMCASVSRGEYVILDYQSAAVARVVAKSRNMKFDDYVKWAMRLGVIPRPAWME